jgi:hypothetical protein
VVATPRGSAPEIIDDGVTGYLRKDPERLAKALLDAADLDRARCRAVACQRFDSDAMVSNHVQLYTDLLCSGTPSVKEATDRASGPKLTIGRGPVLKPVRPSKTRTVPTNGRVAPDSRLN